MRKVTGSQERMVSSNMQSVAIACSSNGNNTIIAAVAKKRIKILGFSISASGAVNVKWRTGTSNDLTGLWYLAINGIASLPHISTEDHFWFRTGVGGALVLNLSGAVAVGGVLTYVVE